MIFGIGKKKKVSSGLSFKRRVESFWDWYATNSRHFLEKIDSGAIDDIVPEIEQNTSEWLVGLSWVFGPGTEDGHSFTITGEGDLSRQFLAEQCRLMSPSLPGWTFYGSRQASSSDSVCNMAISLGDADIDAESIRVVPAVDVEAERVDLSFWHPRLADMPEDQRWQIVFIFLDEALGEFGTQLTVGGLDFRDCDDDEAAISLADLAEYVDAVCAKNEWTKDSPFSTFSVYQTENTSGRFPRGDTMVGTTCHTSLVLDFLNNEGPLDDNPLEGTGAEFIYLKIDASLFPEGKQVDVRGDAEDTLNAQLTEHHAGRTIGGAMGVDNVYIDLLLLDGDRSRQIVDAVMTAMGWQAQYEICSFSKE